MRRSTVNPERINWDETCCRCIYGSTETRTNAKGRCTHKDPDTEFDFKRNCWVCFSFVRKWETAEDLKKARS